LASDPVATPLLLGMGLEEFSLNAAAIPLLKMKIIGYRYLDALEVYAKVMSMDDSKNIKDYLQGK
jgi:phosphoenolpyruvate-protein phosphotransferase (PTS system enzyme I)